MSYMVDYFHVQGVLRWSLILIFMMLKAGLIVAVFMHLVWERLALIYAVLAPPLCLIALVAIMLIESNYPFWTLILFFGCAGEGKHGRMGMDAGGKRDRRLDR